MSIGKEIEMSKQDPLLRALTSFFKKETILKFIRSLEHGHATAKNNVFKLYLIYAKFISIEKVIIERAKELFETESLYETLYFVNWVSNLKRKAPIAQYYDISKKINEKEEREVIKKLLNDYISSSKTEEIYKDALKWQLFKIDNSDLNLSEECLAKEVVGFAHENVQDAIDARLGVYKSRTKSFSKELAYSAFEYFDSLFKKHNKRYFLSSGTLLGVVRDKDFIDNDYDIDLGVFEDEVNRQDIINIVNDSDFIIYESHAFYLLLSHPNGMDIELFFYKRNSHEVYVESDIHKWSYPVFDLIKYDFKGMEVYVPDPPEQYLIANYGNNWINKTMFYDFSYDTTSRCYKKNIDALQYLTQRFISAIKRGDRHGAETCALHLKKSFGLDYSDYFPYLPERH